MSGGPVIAFGQQPCGFFPRRFLVAKIRTARRLQTEVGGRVVNLSGEPVAHAIVREGLKRVLAGMGIRHVGDVTAKMLARQFRDIDALLDAGERLLRPKALSKDEAKELTLLNRLDRYRAFLRQELKRGVRTVLAPVE